MTTINANANEAVTAPIASARRLLPVMRVGAAVAVLLAVNTRWRGVPTWRRLLPRRQRSTGPASTSA
jgi:hypothetical protein